MSNRLQTSRISGFHKMTTDERRSAVAGFAGLDARRPRAARRARATSTRTSPTT